MMGNYELKLEETVKHLQFEISKLKDRISFFENELEIERMRLAACGVVALANTSESAKTNRKMLREYQSGSLLNVERMVDENISLRNENKIIKSMFKEQHGKEIVGDFKDTDLPDNLKDQAS